MSFNPVLSVITVVYNAKELLSKTIESIASQTYANIEYIVVDGKSTDGTAELIKQSSVISKYISEPDNGIYDAMNKGLALATGDYVIFINAGDQFYANSTVEQIFASAVNADVYYGNTLIVDANNNEIGLRRLQPPTNMTWKSLLNGMLVCHQSIVVKRSIAPNYDLFLKVAADYKWVVTSLKNATVVCDSGIVISRFLDGGFNKKHILRSLRERFGVMVQFYGLGAVVLNHIRIGLRFFWYVIRNKRF
jgi:glycosyltransferase involved in cell wall biosynthesis